MKISPRTLSAISFCVLAFAFSVFSSCNSTSTKLSEASGLGASKVVPSHDDAGVPAAGCADGEREGFVNISQYPDIAGCSGGWSIPGVHEENPGTAPACPGVPTFDTVNPACGRQSGDDSANPSGTGCNVADLCAAGWHVCTSEQDVARSSPTNCAGVTTLDDPQMFFTSRQSSNGCAICALGTSTGPDCNSSACVEGCLQTERISNDFFGCGNHGMLVTDADGQCGVLDRFSGNVCNGLATPPWSCTSGGTDTGDCEAYTVTKSDSPYGGVLCCRDSDQNQPPNCQNATATPSILWPPNHALVPIQITGVTDPDSGDQVTLEVTKISQDEPRNGDGDGNTTTDGTGLFTDHPRVRAERSGTGDGRVYHIEFTATDHEGASCTGTVTICVPHDQGPGSACVDQGPLFDSTPP